MYRFRIKEILSYVAFTIHMSYKLVLPLFARFFSEYSSFLPHYKTIFKRFSLGSAHMVDFSMRKNLRQKSTADFAVYRYAD